MKKRNLLGFDFGASSGRAMLGEFDGNTLNLTELHRFSNDPVTMAGRFVWDVPRLFFEMKQALLKARHQGLALDSMGIDTWGVDYGMLDKKGRLMSLPVHYRDSRTDNMREKAFSMVSKEEIFERTGLAFQTFNTLYQLLAMRHEGDFALDNAETMLFMPDLLGYFMTGEMATEYTIASTSQMTNPVTRDWDKELLRKLDIPTHFLTGIQQSGAMRGQLLADIAEETGMSRIPLVAVGSHDTASAVAAVPAKEKNFAYISSGTWSLLGAEVTQPLCTKEVMELNYTNEGGICGTTRLLKNIMGLWIIQECKREWDRQGGTEGFGELMLLAEQAEPFIAVLDVDDERFLAPGGMPERIQAYCAETNQRVPQTKGEICRVIYESLALKYRWAVEQMEEKLLGHRIDVLHIVGGGSKNTMLNQMTANAIGRAVVTGPSEGTVIGNVLVQAMAMGDIANMNEMREVVARSFPTEDYMPEKGCEAMWDDAYARLLRRMEA
ncbi:MAG: rhamnulokinase [Clostridia bacterium]|nr:rhamnulokinase [Clostridia bacterium]MBQ4085890.1 rhamnulokinase [Clostridia bacterium]